MTTKEKDTETKKDVKTTEVKVSKTTKSKLTGKYIEAVGRRKKATARVRLYDNKKGEFLVNGVDCKEYLKTQKLVNIIKAPLEAVGKAEMSVSAIVKSGGLVGQAEAIRHGISRALIKEDAELRPTLKPLGFLTRDSRRKERKKPGLKKARRAPQWSKR